MGKQKTNGVKDKLHIKYSDRFLLQLVSSYSLILLIIMVLGVVSYYVGINTAKKNLNKETQNILKNTVSDIDESFQLILSLNYQIANNTNIVKVVATQKSEIDHTTYINLLYAKNNLINLLAIQNLTFVQDAFIYAHNTDYILSANEVESSSLYYHYNQRYEDEYYEEFMEMIKDPTNAGKPLDLGKYSNNGTHFLLYTYPMSMYRKGANYPATICYTISRKFFEKMFSDLNLYDVGCILIADVDGNELMKIETDHSVDVTIDDIKQIDENNKKENKIMINGEKLIVSTVTSQNNQWTYYLVQPSSMVFDDIADYQFIYFTIIFVAFFAGLFLLFVLSKNNIEPFKRMETQLEDYFIGDDEVEKYKSNDVRISINKYINALIDKKATMQQMLEIQQPFIYSASLSKLMNGVFVSEDDLKKIANNLGINTDNTNFVVLYINVCFNELDFFIDDSLKIKRGYQEVIKEVFYYYFGESIYIYEVDSRSFGILLQWENDSIDFNRKMKELFTKVYDDLRTKYSLIIYSGVSEVFSDLMLTWQAYQHAFEAFNYAGPNNELQEYSHIIKNVNNYYYPLELEQQLVNFITNGKQAQVELIMKNIYVENFKERNLPISMIKCLLSDIRNTLLKVKFTLPQNEENIDRLNEIDAKLDEKKSYELMQSIASDLCGLFESKSTQNVLIDRIQYYITENYMDSDLSLCKISEEFRISESYFSYLFKDVTKVNFSEYLEKIRIDKACELLETTKMSIVDISNNVGYNNPASFRRAFKRIRKITPVEVRSIKK